MSTAKKIFSEVEKKRIVKAIELAEKNTSGEIRVHVESSCKGDVLDQAAYIFKKLNMNKTKLRNGVLFYLSVKNRKFAIIGDAGINAKVPENFWDRTNEAVLSEFKLGNIAEGLVTGIKTAGDQLKSHFPYQTDDINELSDEISFGE